MSPHEIRSRRFTVRRRFVVFGGDLFDRRDVDDFMERCAATVEHLQTGTGAPRISADDIVRHEFRLAAPFSEGYDPDEVDDFLDAVVVEMRALAARAEDDRP